MQELNRVLEIFRNRQVKSVKSIRYTLSSSFQARKKPYLSTQKDSPWLKLDSYKIIEGNNHLMLSKRSTNLVRNKVSQYMWFTTKLSNFLTFPWWKYKFYMCCKELPRPISLAEYHFVANPERKRPKRFEEPPFHFRSKVQIERNERPHNTWPNSNILQGGTVLRSIIASTSFCYWPWWNRFINPSCHVIVIGLKPDGRRAIRSCFGLRY